MHLTETRLVPLTRLRNADPSHVRITCEPPNRADHREVLSPGGPGALPAVQDLWLRNPKIAADLACEKIVDSRCPGTVEDKRSFRLR